MTCPCKGSRLKVKRNPPALSERHDSSNPEPQGLRGNEIVNQRTMKVVNSVERHRRPKALSARLNQPLISAQ